MILFRKDFLLISQWIDSLEVQLFFLYPLYLFYLLIIKVYIVGLFLPCFLTHLLKKMIQRLAINNNVCILLNRQVSILQKFVNIQKIVYIQLSL